MTNTCLCWVTLITISFSYVAFDVDSRPIAEGISVKPVLNELESSTISIITITRWTDNDITKNPTLKTTSSMQTALKTTLATKTEPVPSSRTQTTAKTTNLKLTTLATWNVATITTMLTKKVTTTMVPTAKTTTRVIYLTTATKISTNIKPTKFPTAIKTTIAPVTTTKTVTAETKKGTRQGGVSETPANATSTASTLAVSPKTAVSSVQLPFDTSEGGLNVRSNQPHGLFIPTLGASAAPKSSSMSSLDAFYGKLDRLKNDLFIGEILQRFVSSTTTSSGPPRPITPDPRFAGLGGVLG